MKGHRNKSGFTLIEIILALALFAILVVAFAPAFVTAFRWITDAGKQSNAIYASQDNLESIVSEWVAKGAVTNTTTIDIEFVGTSPIQLIIENYVDGDMEMFLRKSTP